MYRFHNEHKCWNKVPTLGPGAYGALGPRAGTLFQHLCSLWNTPQRCIFLFHHCQQLLQRDTNWYLNDQNKKPPLWTKFRMFNFQLWFCRRVSEVHKKSSFFVIKFQIAIPQRLFIASRASKYMLEGKSGTFGKQTNFCHYWFIETTNDDFQHINSIIYFWIIQKYIMS